LTEAAFFDRVATMFRGHDTPDEALVRACLDSYRSRASTPDLLRTNDELQARHLDHTELIGQLVEYGHRLGLRCWVGKSEHKRGLQRPALDRPAVDVEQRLRRSSPEALENSSRPTSSGTSGTRRRSSSRSMDGRLGEPFPNRARIQDEPTLVRFLVALPRPPTCALARTVPLLRRAWSAATGIS
jgi:hypothetical protein